MKNYNLFFLITASLSLFVTVPGKFAYGLIAVFLMFFLVIIDVAIQGAYSRLKLQLNPQLYVIITLVAITVLFKQLCGIFFPLIELTLSFAFYVVCFSSIMLVKAFINGKKNLYTQAILQFKKLFIFTLFMLLIFLIRDFLGYGTITLPVPYQDVLFSIKPIQAFNGNIFWSTIPGLFAILSIILILYFYLVRGASNE